MEKMLDFPFTWSFVTTRSSFDARSRKKFFKDHGVYGEGMWKRESGLDWISYPFGELVSDDYVLPSESLLLDSTPSLNVFPYPANTSPSQHEIMPINPPSSMSSSNNSQQTAHRNAVSSVVLRDWSEYYRWRELRLDSPISVLLQWPLTVYHIVTNCLQTNYPNISNSTDSRGEERYAEGTGYTLCIHVVGAEKEADLIKTFAELEHLLLEQIDIHLIGPHISTRVDGNVVRCGGRVVVTLHRGLYHTIHSSLPRPTLIMGFNAGLAAYTDWIETIQLLQTTRFPAYFTDYSVKSFEFTRHQLRQWNLSRATDTGGGDWMEIQTSDATINPFRCPLRLGGAAIGHADSEAMFSNGILFHLVYSDISGLKWNQSSNV